MTATILSTIPVLASLNLQESIDFYVGKLGFIERAHYDDYLIVSRDGAEIHFWSCNDRHIAENTSCYIRTADAQSLYDQFVGNGLDAKPPVTQPWGMKELYVIDPHGNLLKFGEVI